jgi:hypothetical protein
VFGHGIERARPLFWEYGRNTNSFGYPGIAHNRSPNVAVRDGPWKLLVNADGSSAELYNLSHDPNEAQNVLSSRRDVADRLTQTALEWRKSLPVTP